MSLSAAQMLEILARSTDPLGGALALGTGLGPELLVEATGRFGARPSAKQARLLVDLGASLAGDTAARSLLDASPGARPAQLWLKAGLLEAVGDHAGAAAAAAAAGYGEAVELRSFRELYCARTLARSTEPAARTAAFAHLRRAASEAPDTASLLAIDKLRGRLRDAGGAARRLRVALLGSSTLDLLGPALRAACLGRGIDADVFVGGYGLFQQEIIGPDTALAAFAPEAVVLILDARTLGLPDEAEDPDATVAGEVARLRGLWERAQARWQCVVLQTNFVVPDVDPYGSLSAALPQGRGRVLRALNLALWEAAAAVPGAHIVDAEQIAATVGKRAWDDPAAWHSAKQAPGPAAVPALAHHLAALLQAAAGLSAKCLVLDLDNTLWGGVVGDDGVDGLQVNGTAAGEAYLDFQRYLRSLTTRGVLLAVCSKNDDGVARAPFREHPEMLLTERDFVQFVANWKPKPENLVAIARALNIGLDSLVFVDDNPAEREAVRRALPEVRVVELPNDPAGFAGAVSDSLALEALSLTEEDRRRVGSYHASGAMAAVSGDAGTLDEFLGSLDMVAKISPFTERDAPRLHQLTNKTNQFNLTTKRMTEAEVRALIGADDLHTQAVRLRDRFGDHGLIAILIARRAGTDLVVEQWLMSCRVFGRRLEELMIAVAADAAGRLGATRLVGVYHPTEKNKEFSDLYGRLGFSLAQEQSDGTRVYHADAAALARTAPTSIRVETSAGAAEDA